MGKKISRLLNLYPYYLFGATIIVFFWPLRNAGFIIDDPQYIWFSARNSWGSIFFDPLTYMYLSPANFTPFLALTFKIDAYCFTVNPVGYNMHTFLSLFLVSCMLYILLRSYSSKVVAICGTMFFIISPSTAEIASWLSTRHYLEGMFCALLSIYFIQRWESRRNSLSFVLVTFAYLLAALYKEVYVPLPAVAFLLMSGDIRSRFFRTLPLWTGLLIYVPYRVYMLGGNFGGYPASVFSLQEVAHNVIMLSHIVPGMLFGQFWILPLLLSVLLFLLLIAKKRYVLCTGIFVSYLVILIPIATLDIQTISFRYLFHATTFILVLVAMGWHLVWEQNMQYRMPAVLMLLAIFFLWTNKSIEIRDTYKQYRDQTTADVVALLQNKDRPFMISHAPEICDLNWYFDGIKKMYQFFEGVDIHTKILFPKYIKYNPPERIQEVLDSLAGNGDHMQGSFPGDYDFKSEGFEKMPLTVSISTDGYAFRWEFGPAEGPYTVMVRREGEFFFPYKFIPRKGRYFFAPGFADILYFRILYQKQDGMEVVSPEFELRFPSQVNQRMEWL